MHQSMDRWTDTVTPMRDQEPATKDAERRYITKEAAELLGLKQQT